MSIKSNVSDVLNFWYGVVTLRRFGSLISGVSNGTGQRLTEFWRAPRRPTRYFYAVSPPLWATAVSARACNSAHDGMQTEFVLVEPIPWRSGLSFPVSQVSQCVCSSLSFCPMRYSSIGQKIKPVCMPVSQSVSMSHKTSWTLYRSQSSTNVQQTCQQGRVSGDVITYCFWWKSEIFLSAKPEVELILTIAPMEKYI